MNNQVYESFLALLHILTYQMFPQFISVPLWTIGTGFANPSFLEEPPGIR